MIDYEALLKQAPYGMPQCDKERFYARAVAELSEHHRVHCEPYQRLCQGGYPGMPLPVRLFKLYDLLSIPRESVKKTMTSSGTTGQAVSKIFLDAESAALQTRVLAAIVGDFLGKERRPMLILDSCAVIKDRRMFSARGAGILGFSMFGRGAQYALDENMELNRPLLEEFCAKYAGEPVLLFGFTFMVWQYVIAKLKEIGLHLNLNGTLIHGGGWKKLVSLSISNEQFKEAVQEWTGISTVLNYYGMVEQTGSIFMECPCGRLHASIFSDVDILDPVTMEKKNRGRGLMQCTSLLPTSYPGHVLLTEDEGEITGVDDCPCGRLGKTFLIHGRVAGAEIRGCSDTYEKH